MTVANPKLVDAIVKPLLGTFETHPNPWWWPMGDGATKAQWGLDFRHAAPFKSLTCGNALETARSRADYSGFLGSLGSTRESCRLWVMSARPSSNAYPGAVSTNLLNVLRKNGWLERTHVTNVIKFRGPGPDQQADQGLNEQLWSLSLTALMSEFAETDPDLVLVAGNKAQQWVRDVLSPRAAQFPELTRLLGRKLHVPYWTQGVVDPAGRWREAVKAAGTEL